MKKNNQRVGIVTIISRNYGNRLQNYALQEKLKEMGYEAKTVPLTPYFNSKRKMKLIVKKILGNTVLKNRSGFSLEWDKFDNLIKWSNYDADKKRKRLINTCDVFVTGSDQVWNPNFDFIGEREFLTFARPEQRIAYAASIGIEKLPCSVREIYTNYFNGIKSISVREEAGSKIVEECTGRNVEVVLDPTMLLSVEDWKKVSKNSSIQIKQPYIFKYFLGVCNERYDNFINNIAKRNGWKVVDILNPESEFKNKIGPTEFIYLIENSQIVMTDSFHGTVFSILFNKPFRVFDRTVEEKDGKMSSRLDTLLGKFKLTEYLITDEKALEKEFKSIDYDKVKEILNQERKKSEQYLKNALNLHK